MTVTLTRRINVPTINEEIIRLSAAWYTYVGFDHHKDRDCRWYIETRYSYGREPVYAVTHDGYLGDRIEALFPNYESAEAGLLLALQTALREAQQDARGSGDEGEDGENDFILGVDVGE